MLEIKPLVKLIKPSLNWEYVRSIWCRIKGELEKISERKRKPTDNFMNEEIGIHSTANADSPKILEV